MIAITFTKNPNNSVIEVKSWFYTTEQLAKNIESIPGVFMVFDPADVPYEFYRIPNAYKYHDGRLIKKKQ